MVLSIVEDCPRSIRNLFPHGSHSFQGLGKSAKTSDRPVSRVDIGIVNERSLGILPRIFLIFAWFSKGGAKVRGRLSGLFY